MIRDYKLFDSFVPEYNIMTTTKELAKNSSVKDDSLADSKEKLASENITMNGGSLHHGDDNEQCSLTSDKNSHSNKSLPDEEKAESNSENSQDRTTKSSKLDNVEKLNTPELPSTDASKSKSLNNNVNSENVSASSASNDNASSPDSEKDSEKNCIANEESTDTELKEALLLSTPGSPLLSDDLEESLLKDDINITSEGQEDFCEENLLQEIDEEALLKDKADEKEEPLPKSTLKDEEKSSDSDRQEKEIKKILKNLNSSLGKKDDNGATSVDKPTKTKVKSIVNNSDNTEEKSNPKLINDSSFGAGSNSSMKEKSNTKLSDDSNTEVASNSSSREKSTSKAGDTSNEASNSTPNATPKAAVKISRTDRKKSDNSSSSNSNSSSLLLGNSNSKASGKRSCPDDKSNSSNKMLKIDEKDSKPSNQAKPVVDKLKTVTEEPKDKKESTVKAVTKKNAITFSEALKSIALENNKDPLIIPMNKPQPLVPVTEISPNDITHSESLTVLEPLYTPARTLESNQNKNSTSSGRVVVDLENDGQGKKRPLAESNGLTHSSRKPDLKKIRVFRNEDNTKKNVSDVTKPVEVSKTTSSLQEEKSLDSRKSNADKTLEKEGLICIDQEDIHQKAVNEARNLSNTKLKRIKRKDLESLVIELFVDKVLYEHQLGQQKDLCKRLEGTLENNRKKAAQFHKEIEDLRKVTQRLQAEHLARKGQVIAPVKVKRSVGIQATPTIIGKGIMHASSNNNIRVLSPTSNVETGSIGSTSNSNTNSRNLYSNQVSETYSPTTSSATQTKASTTTISTNTVQIPKNDPKLSTNSTIVPRQLTSVNDNMKILQPGSVVTSQPLTFTNSPTGSQMVVVNPVVVQQPQNVGGVRIIRTPLTPVSSSSSTTTSTHFSAASPVSVQGGNNSTSNSSSSTFIDLTDDDEAKSKKATAAGATTAAVTATITATTTTTAASVTATTLPPGSLLTIQRTPAVNVNQNSSGQFVALNPPTSVGQLLLVPSTPGQPTTALVVGNVTNSTQSISTGIVRSAAVTQSSNVRFTSSNIVNTARVVTVGTNQINGGNFVSQVSRHPAPLPRAPPQQTSGYSKKLPPVPILKLSHKDNSIILSWNMAKTDEHERVASYQLYAYQEGTAPPTPTLWKKVGSVKALELPMACTLTQFMPGHVYHFAVRAVDIRSRLGPFSDPRSIRLGK